MNINEEQTEEVVITGVKQLEKEIEGGKAICTKMVEKDIDKPSQVDENQMSLVTTMAMLKVGKEWEDIVNWFIVIIKITQDREHQQQKRYDQ